MKAEFFKDENGVIWFYYAQNIHVRKNKSLKEQNSKDAKKKAKEIQANKEQ